MSSKLQALLAAAGLAVLTTITAVTPAHASGGACKTNSPTPVYQRVEGAQLVGYLFTLSPDRGFSFSLQGGTDGPDGVLNYLYGHGAEHPDHDGYVRAEHISC